MKKMTFLEWVESLVEQIEEPELPDNTGCSTYQKGYKKGCFETQRIIGSKLKHALNAEKKRLEEENKWKKEMEANGEVGD